MKKIFLYFLLMFILLFTLTGCWDWNEINQLAIVMGTGVDYTADGKIRLTLQIARPSQFGGGENTSGFTLNNVWVVSQTGNTIMEAERLLQAKISRSIFWHHNLVLVVGEEMAKQGLYEVIDFFTCYPGGRETINVMVTKGKAEELLKSHSQLENTSSQAITSILKNTTILRINLKELTMMLASKGINPILPLVELIPSGIPQGPGLGENIQQENASANLWRHAEITLTGMGLFKNDKLLGWLGITETRGYGWLKDKVKSGVITIPSPNEPGKKISIEISNAKTKIEPFYDGENIWFDVHVKAEGDLFEQQSTENLNDPTLFAEVNKLMAIEIKDSIELSLEKSRDYGVDIFGFGDIFHRKYKNDWPALEDNWDREFVNAAFNITVNTKIVSTGLELQSISK